VISVELAVRLRDAGLVWDPAPGDRFAIPDRGLDDETFVLSDMTIQVYELPKGAIIGFNGTTEWALDDIERDEAIWLPREDQLRGLLGDGFESLRRGSDGYRVTTVGRRDAVGTSAEEAYALAVLRELG
jgi:hypothetical protein